MCGIVRPESVNCTLVQETSVTDVTTKEITFELVVHLYFIGFLCILGIFGNVVSIVVLRKDKERREALMLLQALAVADGLYLLIALFRYPLKHLLPNEENHVHMQPVVFPLLKTFQTICIWTMVLVTIDRYIYVCHPLRAQLIFTRRSRRMWAIGIFFAGLAYNMPRFFANCVVTIVNPCDNSTVSHMIPRPLFHSTLYYDIYKNALYIVLLYVGPLSVLCFMNCRLVKAIQYSRRRHANCTHASHSNDMTHDNNATLVLIIIVLVFIVCQTPELIFKILNVLQSKQTLAVPTHRLEPFFHVSELLMVINSSINFAIYLIFGRRFRLVLKETFQYRFMSTTTLLTRETAPLQQQQPNPANQVVHFANNHVYHGLK